MKPGLVEGRVKEVVMGRYKEDYSRRGQWTMIWCVKCGARVRGRILVGRYWGYDRVLEELGDGILEALLGRPASYLVIEDDHGEKHEGEEK